MNRWHINVVLCAAGLLLTANAWAGNREMVEKSVQELDGLNRAVVQQVPDLPKNGQVKIKARVKPNGTAELLETEIIRPPEKAESPASVAKGNPEGLKSSLKRRARGEAQILPYRDDNSDGRYPRLRDALAVNFGQGCF